MIQGFLFVFYSWFDTGINLRHPKFNPIQFIRDELATLLYMRDQAYVLDGWEVCCMRLSYLGQHEQDRCRWSLRGWSHRPNQTPSVGNSGCNNGLASIYEHNPQQFHGWNWTESLVWSGHESRTPFTTKWRLYLNNLWIQCWQSQDSGWIHQ